MGESRQAWHGKGQRPAARAIAGLLLGPVAAFGAVDGAAAETFKVKNTKARGKGSFHAAVERANRGDDRDRILFVSRLSGDVPVRGYLGVREVAAIASRSKRVDLVGRGPSAELAFTDCGVSGRSDTHSLRGLDLVDLEIYADCNLKIRRSTITGSDESDSGDASDHDGVYSYTSGGVEIRKSRISGWSTGVAAIGGGGIDVMDSIVSSNNTGVQAVKGRVTVTRSTITGNEETGATAIYYGGVLLRNSTLSGNGDAIYGDVAIENSTITGNDGLVGSGPSGPFYEPTIVNSIAVENQRTDGAPECETPVVISSGGNVFNQGDVCVKESAESDVFTPDAGLQPLGDNGGPTPTHALTRRSPAIDHAVRVDDLPRIDQRGVRRDQRPDSGSYELDD